LSALHTCFDIVAFGDISRDADRSNTMFALQRRSQGFDAVGAAGSAADSSACGSKCFRYCLANAAGGASYLLRHMTAFRGIVSARALVPKRTALAKVDRSFENVRDASQRRIA
jgi:hypothetical protein